MFGLGIFEILFLLFLALVLIGPKQLPEVARTIGRFINELKRTTSVLTEEMKQSMDHEISKIPPPSTPPPPTDEKFDKKLSEKKDGSEHV